MVSSLADPLTLPSGLVLRNRLVKAAMVEGLAKPNHEPNSDFDALYREWGTGGWGAVATGNIIVHDRFAVSPGDLMINKNPMVEKWKTLLAAIKTDGAPAIAQISHPGRQAPFTAGGTRSWMEKPVAPSAIPLTFGDSIVAKLASAILFGTPREMTTVEVKELVAQFADAAKFLADIGFDGVELHAAHGFMLAQFLSPKCNIRNDEYGGSAANRARVIVEIIETIRQRTPRSFTIGIKFNSADVSNAGTLNETLEQIGLIENAGIDFLQISGGTLEDPQMLHAPNAKEVASTTTSAREAFFLDFARAVRDRFPNLTLMVTGGFRTRVGMEAALAEGACDIIGLGRPSVIHPHWPKDVLLNREVSDEAAQVALSPVEMPWVMKKLAIKALGAGSETDYYMAQMHRLVKGLPAIPPGVSHVESRL